MDNKEVKKAKRRIAGLTNKFESRMMAAKNALERVQVLNDMEDVLDAEVIQWHETLIKESVDDPKEQKNLEDNIFVEIQKLQDVIKSINKQRLEMLPEAKQVAQAHKNSHIIVKPTKHVTDEH